MIQKNNARIFVAGHQGMVGSAIVRELSRRGEQEIVCVPRSELDLTSQSDVRDFFGETAVDEIYLAAAKVGGIHANNTLPADFIYENLTIAANVIHEAWRAGVKKLLFLGSSCIYPRLAPQPMEEQSLLTGPLEPTNEPYAIAKIAGLKLCESYNRQYGVDYRSVMPTNLYGVNDNYHAENAHVIPALIRRFHEAKVRNAPEVVIWGTGNPRREFLYVDDMARACVDVMRLDPKVYSENTQPMLSHINVGTGEDLSIRDLATRIAEVVGYEGKIAFDPGKPDGMPRKLLDVSCLNRLGWSPHVELTDGLRLAYDDFCKRFG